MTSRIILPLKISIFILCQIAILVYGHAEACTVDLTTIQSRIKTLRRSVYVYHSASRELDIKRAYRDEFVPYIPKTSVPLLFAYDFFRQGFSPQLDDPQSRTYIEKMIQNYEFVRGPQWQLGYGGIYAAPNVIKSLPYRGTPGVTLEIELKKGSRYLDYRECSSLFFDQLNSQKNFSKNLKKFRIGAVLYQYPDKDDYLERKRFLDQTTDAFLITDSKAIGVVRAYFDQVPRNASYSTLHHYARISGLIARFYAQFPSEYYPPRLSDWNATIFQSLEEDVRPTFRLLTEWYSKSSRWIENTHFGASERFPDERDHYRH